MPLFDPVDDLKSLYFPSPKQPVMIDVPEMAFLMVDGTGDPNTAPAFAKAIEGLYGVAYTIKFTLKKVGVGSEFKVAPLEGLFWTGGSLELVAERPDDWQWTLMIALPDFVTADHVQDALAALRKKRGPEAASGLRLERFHEGRAAQIMHIGPYADEPPTIERLHAFITKSGHALAGKHHEIYLSDPRRCAPEKMRTVVRQPVG